MRSSAVAHISIAMTAAAVLVAWSAGGARRVAASAQGVRESSGNAATAADVAAACGTCHLVPPPEILPRGVWRDEIARMVLIRDNLPQPPGPPGTAARMVPLAPEMERVVRYYEAHAPAQLPPPAPWPDPESGRFVKRSFANPPDQPSNPAVSNVRLLDLDGDARLELVATDMRYGVVFTGQPYAERPGLRVIANVPNPAHVSMLDFDRDGIKDFLVADLGEFRPGDHTHGTVVWLRGTSGGQYMPLALEGWPRVSDVEAGDFNGDGTLDLAVAAFGWRKVGNVSLLENRTTDYTRPSFVPHQIDPRPGSIHAMPVDLNKDGKLDLVVLFAQQFETVVAYLNAGGPGFSFTPQVIYTAPHPNWGSSGIELTDLDADGDPDVLLTHGDTFDDTLVKPYHGIQWLENRGSFPFFEHRLAELPAVSRAEAADLDGDGDLDIVASSFVAGETNVTITSLPSLVWLEQIRRGEFKKHTLEMGEPYHATLDVGDFDRDGDIDIVVGNFRMEQARTTWVDIWENRGGKSHSASAR